MGTCERKTIRVHTWGSLRRGAWRQPQSVLSCWLIQVRNVGFASWHVRVPVCVTGMQAVSFSPIETIPEQANTVFKPEAKNHRHPTPFSLITILPSVFYPGLSGRHQQGETRSPPPCTAATRLQNKFRCSLCMACFSSLTHVVVYYQSTTCTCYQQPPRTISTHLHSSYTVV